MKFIVTVLSILLLVNSYNFSNSNIAEIEELEIELCICSNVQNVVKVNEDLSFTLHYIFVHDMYNSISLAQELPPPESAIKLL